MRQIVGDAIRFMTLIRYSVKYRRFTMIAPRIFAENLLLAEKALAELPEGAVIECGTWKGGMAAALVEVGGENRRYYFFDCSRDCRRRRLSTARLLWLIKPTRLVLRILITAEPRSATSGCASFDRVPP